MTDAVRGSNAVAHDGSHVRAYLRVFLALLVLTVLEYLYARGFANSPMPVLVGGLVSLAVIKATLVGLFFMHLAFEGRWKYLILLPTAFLATVVVLGIYPDMAYPPASPAGVETPAAAPNEPGTTHPSLTWRLQSKGNRSTPYTYGSPHPIEIQRMSSYRLGILIVLAVVVPTAMACLATVETGGRASQQLAGKLPPLPAFRFTERSGREVTEADLQNKVWIAAFIFTRCKTSCPVITGAMGRVQEQLQGTPVQLVSISVDPEHDTPGVLADFAKRYRADPQRWWFLTGDREATYDLIRGGFLQAVKETTEEERQQPGVEEFEHSSRLTLVDQGNRIVAMYDARDDAELEKLVARARELAKIASAPAWARKLPAVNASLNGACTLLLLVGLALVRSGSPRAHTLVMASALTLSAIFLACYLIYHAQVGSVRFPGQGASRLLYYTILWSHIILAVVMLPMIILTVLRAVRKRFELHRKVSTVTYPVWLYVSITGVVIYWMLYQIDWSPAQL